MAKTKRVAAFILAAITIFCLAAGVKYSGAYTLYTFATAKESYRYIRLKEKTRK